MLYDLPEDEMLTACKRFNNLSNSFYNITQHGTEMYHNNIHIKHYVDFTNLSFVFVINGECFVIDEQLWNYPRFNKFEYKFIKFDADEFLSELIEFLMDYYPEFDKDEV